MCGNEEESVQNEISKASIWRGREDTSFYVCQQARAELCTFSAAKGQRMRGGWLSLQNRFPFQECKIT